MRASGRAAIMQSSEKSWSSPDDACVASIASGSAWAGRRTTVATAALSCGAPPIRHSVTFG